jgi:hypothetical protein
LHAKDDLALVQLDAQHHPTCQASVSGSSSLSMLASASCRVMGMQLREWLDAQRQRRRHHAATLAPGGGHAVSNLHVHICLGDAGHCPLVHSIQQFSS